MARVKKFSKIVTNDRELTKVQENVETAIYDFLRVPILDGNLLENISLSAGNNIIEHKLDRRYRGYIIVKQDSVSSFFVDSEQNNKIYLRLNSSGSTTVSIWIF